MMRARLVVIWGALFTAGCGGGQSSLERGDGAPLDGSATPMRGTTIPPVSGLGDGAVVDAGPAALMDGPRTPPSDGPAGPAPDAALAPPSDGPPGAGPDAATAPACPLLAGDIPGALFRRESQIPKRLVVVYTPLGTVLDEWRPTGGETDFTLSRILAPLAPVRSTTTILEGLDNITAPQTLAPTNRSGASVLLTADPGVAASGTNGFTFTCGGAASVEVLLANRATPVPVVHLGVQVVAASPLDGPLLPHYAGARGAILPENNPARAAARLGVDLRSPVADPLADASVPQVTRAHLDLIAAAFAQRKTDVAAISIGTPEGRMRFPWLGLDQPHGELARQSGATPAAREALVKVQTWFAEQVAYLASRLATIPEGAGTALDNTLIVWISETGEASTGVGRRIPVVLVGRAGGAIRVGRYLRLAAGMTQADLVRTVGVIFGVPGLGHASLNPRPISVLLP